MVKDISKSIKDSATASSSSSSSVAATTHKCILINKTELGKEWDNVFDLVILGETDAVCGEIRRQVEELHAAQSLKAEKARIKKEQKLAASATASTVAEKGKSVLVVYMSGKKLLKSYARLFQLLKATLKSLSGPTTPLRSSLLAKQQQQQQQQPTGFGKLGFRSSKKLQPVVKITSSTVTATSPSSVGSSKQTHSTVDVGGNDIIPLRKAVAVVNSGGVGGCLPLAVSSPPSKSAVEAALKRSFIPSPIKKTAFAAIENCSSSISMQQKFKKKE